MDIKNKDSSRCLDNRIEIMDILTNHIKENKDYLTKVVKLGNDFAVITENGFVFLRFLALFDAFLIFEHYNESTEEKDEDRIQEFYKWLDLANFLRPQYFYEDYRKAIRKVQRILDRI